MDQEDVNPATAAFLKKHRLQLLTYQDILERLHVNSLFDYWDQTGDDAHESYSYYTEEYESEREYFEQYNRIYYCEGDMEIDGDLKIPDDYFDLLVVNGNMNVRGKIDSSYGEATHYYVSGNTTADCLYLGLFQKTGGKETCRYTALAWGQDDEVVHTMPDRKIDAPFFFSWFYDLHCFEFAPHTLITALYNSDELSAYKTSNALLEWHDYACAFRPEFYGPVSESHHDSLTVYTDKICEALKNNQPVLLDGVTAAGIQRTRQGIRLKNQGDLAAAYQCFKEAVSISPSYYWAHFYAGKCLWQQQAFAQAMTRFAAGIPFTPEKIAYESACMEQAALCAIRTGEYTKALEWAEMSLQKNANSHFAWRVQGEAYLYMKQLNEAKNSLEKSAALSEIFTTCWLLGLVYYLQGDHKKADKYYRSARDKNAKAQPYTEQTNLTYFYGEATTVDWDTVQQQAAIKDQPYWDEFFNKTLQQYGPDLYRRTGEIPYHWISRQLNIIPEQYRNSRMLQALMTHQTNGEYDVNGNVLQYFKPELIDQETVLLAINREEPCYYDHIPPAQLNADVFNTHPHGIDLSPVPAGEMTYELCFRAVAGNQYNYNYVPETFKDERMNIALIAGGALSSSSGIDLPLKYHSNEYIRQAIDLGIQIIEHIPARWIDTSIYQYLENKYGNEAEWPFIVERHDRQSWRYGSPSDIARMGKMLRKYGMDIFEQVHASQINQHSYQYFEKHLGHLPAFQENVKAFGWDERANEADEDIQQFHSDTFDNVWACFWDEDFIINALNAEEPERIYQVPHQYLTQKICDVAVSRDSYDFAFVPATFITPQLCEIACSQDYGSALEYVPMAMRSESVCNLALNRDADNIKFVPLQLRDINRCLQVLSAESGLYPYVPYQHYTTVFETLFQKERDHFHTDFLLLLWGLGLIIDKQYTTAQEKLAAVEQVEEVSTARWHQALYYIGWSYHLQGDSATAETYWQRAQDVAQSGKIDETYRLSLHYASFQLPPVPEAHDREDSPQI